MKTGTEYAQEARAIIALARQQIANLHQEFVTDYGTDVTHPGLLDFLGKLTDITGIPLSEMPT